MSEISEKTMEKINGFARRNLTPDEVFCFSVILCDNEIDRDNQKFSVAALEKLSKLFVGKTGIFNHDPKGENQTARIYDTRVVSDETKRTADGEAYTYLHADVYMVRTDSNKDLIKEIDGGIKKEVSVGCAVERELCSVCGRDVKANPCNHRKGVQYAGKKCFGILSEPVDAYEWSFVAVPAQRSAGVTKRYSEESTNKSLSDETEYIYVEAATLSALTSDLREEIIRLSFLEGDSLPVSLTKSAIKRMDIAELIELKHALRDEVYSAEASELSCALEAKRDSEYNKHFKL